MKRLKKAGDKILLKKLFVLLEEIQKHPYFGTGQPEALKGSLSGMWSRRLDKKNRILYEVFEDYVEVSIISVKGHYDDK